MGLPATPLPASSPIPPYQNIGQSPTSLTPANNFNHYIPSKPTTFLQLFEFGISGLGKSLLWALPFIEFTDGANLHPAVPSLGHELGLDPDMDTELDFAEDIDLDELPNSVILLDETDYESENLIHELPPPIIDDGVCLPEETFIGFGDANPVQRDYSTEKKNLDRQRELQNEAYQLRQRNELLGNITTIPQQNYSPVSIPEILPLPASAGPQASVADVVASVATTTLLNGHEPKSKPKRANDPKKLNEWVPGLSVKVQDGGRARKELVMALANQFPNDKGLATVQGLEGRFLYNPTNTSYEGLLSDILRRYATVIREDTTLLALTQTIKAGIEARNQILSGSMAYIYFLLKRMGFISGKEGFDDMVQMACIIAIKLIAVFDSERGRFTAYIGKYLPLILHRAKIATEKPLHVPKNELLLEGHVNEAQKILAQKLNRVPSALEVATYLELPLTEYHQRWGGAIFASYADSLTPDAMFAEDVPIKLAETAESSPAWADIETRLTFEEVLQCFDSLKISPRARLIFLDYYFSANFTERSLAQIGETNGLTKERIRQILNKVLVKLRTKLGVIDAKTAARRYNYKIKLGLSAESGKN